MLFLDEKDIIVLGSVCRSLNSASNDEYIWRLKSIELRGESEYKNLIREYEHVTRSYEENIAGRAFKIK
jgi:hypothetical protein